MILAAGSIDDVYVIVVYSVLIAIQTGTSVKIIWQLTGIPISISLVAIVRAAIGLVVYRMFLHFNPRATKRVFVILGLSVLLVHFEHLVIQWVPLA